jgi:hypothetical protein
MPLIRCPKHGIPYNEDNPRGCPACALEKEGGEQATVMRELARASQMVRRPTDNFTAVEAERAASVTSRPRLPMPISSPFDKLIELVRRRPLRVAGIPLIALLLAALVFRSGPKYLAEPSPAPISGTALPLPIEPGMPLSAVFGILGVQPPRPSPEASQLERYSYGSDLAIDALSGAVYLITLTVPNRSWHGLRPGIPGQQAEGALALLAAPQPAQPPTSPRADTLSGWVVYPSLEGRPRRTLKAEVRPPNGCYDAVVDIQPRATGIVVAGTRRYATIGRREGLPEWVATRIQIVNRAVTGPRGPAAC